MVLAIAVFAIPAYGGCDRGSWALCGFRIGIDDVEFALLIGDDPKIAAAVDGDTSGALIPVVRTVAAAPLGLRRIHFD